MRRSPLTIGLAAALLWGIATPGIAQTSAKATALTQAQVVEKLQAAGYTKVHGVEKEGKHFDADAMKDGKAVHLHVDASTGAIMPANDEDEREEAEEHEHDKS
jgi:hypothetical protein